MKYYFLFLSCIFLFISCNDDDNDDLNDVYEFQDMSYIVEDDDGMENVVNNNIDPYVFPNSTTEPVIYKYGELTWGLTEASSFDIDIVSSYKIDKDFKTKVPSNIEGKNISLSEEEYSFSSNDEIQYRRTTGEEMTVEPNTKVETKVIVHGLNLKATYLVTFIGKNTGKTLIMKGKWYGYRVNSLETTNSVSPLE